MLTFVVVRIMRRNTAIAFSAVIGAICILAAFMLYKDYSASTLFIQLVPSGESRTEGVVLRFTNIGSREVLLDSDRMRLSLVPIFDESLSLLVYARSDATIRGAGEGGSVSLAPGESLDSIDLLPAVKDALSRQVVKDDVFLSASYESVQETTGRFWSGTVKSFPIKLDL